MSPFEFGSALAHVDKESWFIPTPLIGMGPDKAAIGFKYNPFIGYQR